MADSPVLMSKQDECTLSVYKQNGVAWVERDVSIIEATKDYLQYFDKQGKLCLIVGLPYDIVQENNE